MDVWNHYTLIAVLWKAEQLVKINSTLKTENAVMKTLTSNM